MMLFKRIARSIKELYKWPCKTCGRERCGINKDICTMARWHCNRDNNFFRFEPINRQRSENNMCVPTSSMKKPDVPPTSGSSIQETKSNRSIVIKVSVDTTEPDIAISKAKELNDLLIKGRCL